MIAAEVAINEVMLMLLLWSRCAKLMVGDVREIIMFGAGDAVSSLREQAVS